MIDDGAPEAHFDARHRVRDDPWGAASRWYEIRKRGILLASLPQERLGHVLEIGCSVGITTQDLAPRADSVLALDVSGEAVERARARLVGLDNVRVERADVNRGLPGGSYDVVVLSEVGYYLSAQEFDGLLDDIEASLASGGTLVACHWRHDEGDFLQSGDAVHEAIAARTGLGLIAHHEEQDFVLDVVSVDPRSVAERTGLR